MKKVILIATVALLGTAWSMLNSRPTQESTCERNNVEAVSDNEVPEVEVRCCVSPEIGDGQCWATVINDYGKDTRMHLFRQNSASLYW